MFYTESVTMRETKKGLSRVQKLKKRLSRSFGRLGKIENCNYNVLFKTIFLIRTLAATNC